ncbi:MAG: M28 family peptidase [Sulfolobales archaeon]|nr:M28 family peptidase [Sulfolobales archaeon]MCX8185935.1 M28 family peptidase [Sulfolobales archaeon]MDW7969192.1 M28 family peptidase [Sulfolobales archaeon]
MKELLTELSSLSDVVSGSREEYFVISKLREFFERLNVHAILAAVDVMSWRDVYCSVNGIQCKSLPPTRSCEVGGLLTDDLRDCDGKILVTSTTEFPDNVWVIYNLAVERGANAVIFYDAYPSRHRRIVITGVWSYSLGEGGFPPIPAAHLRLEDGARLRNLIGSYVDLRCITETKLSTGYNVEAFIGGRKEREILITAHHDRWFTGFRDDLVGLYALLKLTHRTLHTQTPKYTLRLVSFTAEEFGNPKLSPWYWSYGSREYASTSKLDNVEFVVNLDTACMEPVRVNATGPEIGKYFVRHSTINYIYEGFDHPYSDGLTFSSRGIPVTTLQNLRDIDDIYHTDLDTFFDVESFTDGVTSWILNAVNNYDVDKLEFKEYYEVLKSSLPHELKSFIDKILATSDPLVMSKIFREISKELVKPVILGSYRDLNKDLITLLAPHALIINNLRRGIKSELRIAGSEEELCCSTLDDNEAIHKYMSYLNDVLAKSISIK